MASAVVEVRAMLAAAVVCAAMRLEGAFIRVFWAVMAELVLVMLPAAVCRLELPAIAILGVVGLSEGVNRAAVCTAVVFPAFCAMDVIVSQGSKAAPVTVGALQPKPVMPRSEARTRR
eukprot:8773539-Pyramimonas_sp.AAC.1